MTVIIAVLNGNKTVCEYHIHISRCIKCILAIIPPLNCLVALEPSHGMHLTLNAIALITVYTMPH